MYVCIYLFCNFSYTVYQNRRLVILFKYELLFNYLLLIIKYDLLFKVR